MTPWCSLGRGRSAASTFYPSVPPAENATKPICSRENASTPHRRLHSPSGSPPESTQTRSEPTNPDNRMTSENALTAIPIHGGIGTEHIASCPVWRYAANSRRDRTQDIPREPCDRHDRARNAHVRRAARRPLPRAPTPRPELKPAGTNAAPAHNSRSLESENRFFASARNNAQIKIPHPHLRERRLKQNRARTK